MQRRRLLFAAPLMAVPAVARAQPGFNAPALTQLKWQPDNGGPPMRLTQLLGKPLVLTMSYTACRRTCATTMLVLREMQAIFDRTRRDVNVAIVTYDPERDSPAEWVRYRETRGLTRASWHFLTGSAADTRRLARYLDLDYWFYDRHVMHDFRIALFNAHGDWHKELVWDQPKNLEAFLADV